MTNFARSERRSLAALLRTLGPDAPTLCEGWDARDLAVHLVIRDRRPDALIGNAMPGLASRSQGLQDRATQAEAELAELPWGELVGLVAEGGPRWNPMSWGPLDRLANTAEFLVHHEDVRRAQPDWEPRDLAWDLNARVFAMVRSMVLPVSLKAGRHLVLEAPGFGTVSAGRTVHPSTTLRGTPVELLLWLFGRQEHARLEVTESGPPRES